MPCNLAPGGGHHPWNLSSRSPRHLVSLTRHWSPRTTASRRYLFVANGIFNRIFGGGGKGASRVEETEYIPDAQLPVPKELIGRTYLKVHL